MTKLIRTVLASTLPLAVLAVPVHATPALQGETAPVVRAEPVQGVLNQS